MALAMRRGFERGGILIRATTAQSAEQAHEAFLARLGALGLRRYVVTRPADPTHAPAVAFLLAERFLNLWSPLWSTLELGEALAFDARSGGDDLEREILLAMLVSPQPLVFPSHEELVSAVRIRQFTVEAARRPQESGDAGGDALASGTRATARQLLQAIAREVERSNPSLLARLAQWAGREDVAAAAFLRERGSAREMLPPKYFIPGERVRIGKPAGRVASVAGDEVSSAIYLGQGEFSNPSCAGHPFHWGDGIGLGVTRESARWVRPGTTDIA